MGVFAQTFCIVYVRTFHPQDKRENAKKRKNAKRHEAH
jgi:hypothetical protein